MLTENKREAENQLVEPSDKELSVITDYDSDPHIYNHIWQFIFSIVGFAVGYGSFWRFPYMIYKNGGGAFLIPYVISVTLIAIPCAYLEAAVGQMHRASAPFVFKRIHPALKFVGLAILLCSFHISAYYNILMTYSYRFIASAFLVPLPFEQEKIS